MLGCGDETIAEMFQRGKEEETYGTVQIGISFLSCDMSSPGCKEEMIILFA